MTPRLALALSAAWLAGCGSGKNAGPVFATTHADGSAGLDDDGVDGGDEYADAGAYQPGIPDGSYKRVPAAVDAGVRTWDALPAPPQVVNDDGGVLPTPEVVAVFFSNEDPTLLPQLEAFYTGLGASPQWQVGQEYGVGTATAKIVTLAEAAPSSIDDTTDPEGDNTALQTWLLGEISSKALPAPGNDLTYMINYPAGTVVTADGTACQDFNGYHSDAQTADGTLVSYGVLPRCSEPGETDLDAFTMAASHEVMEAATDPWPDYAPAWAQVDNAHLFFDEANSGSEVADMCENDPEAFYTFPGFPFLVQRIWSNAAALAGHDPCVPEIPGKVFFNAVPELPDTGLYDFYMQDVMVSSVHIPVGGTGTTYIDLYSDGATPDWDVVAVDYNYFFSQGSLPTLLDLDMPVTSGNNGDRLPVTITVRAAGDPTTNMQLPNTELFVVYSTQGTSAGVPAHLWYGVVTN